MLCDEQCGYPKMFDCALSLEFVNKVGYMAKKEFANVINFIGLKIGI